MKMGKAAGIDEIPPEMCKMFARECKEVCLDLINGCLNKNVYSRMCKKERLVMIG